jgi:hypothetical protein
VASPKKLAHVALATGDVASMRRRAGEKPEERLSHGR